MRETLNRGLPGPTRSRTTRQGTRRTPRRRRGRPSLKVGPRLSRTPPGRRPGEASPITSAVACGHLPHARVKPTTITSEKYQKAAPTPNHQPNIGTARPTKSSRLMISHVRKARQPMPDASLPRRPMSSGRGMVPDSTKLPRGTVTVLAPIIHRLLCSANRRLRWTSTSNGTNHFRLERAG